MVEISKKTIGIALIVMCLFLVLVAGIQLGYFNKYVLVAILILSIICMVAIAIVFTTGKIGVAENKDAERKDDTNYYFRRINELLLLRNEGDSIDWTGGQNVRVLRKTFQDSKKENHEYIGVSGLLTRYKKWVVVIYNIAKDDFEAYYGDPSPSLINNAFHRFDPFNQQAQQSFMPFPTGNRFSPYGKRGGAVNINLGGGGDATDAVNLGEQASKVMQEIDLGK